MASYSINDNIFNKIDTQDKAYFLGLLYADGCNYEEDKRVKLDLIETDFDILNKFKKFLSYEGNIKHYPPYVKSIMGKECNASGIYRLSFKSKNISEDLAKYGCTKNKSYTLLYPKELIKDDELLRHFIRGYFDGDGCISYWIDNKKTGHKKFQICFCGTTDMMENLSNIFSEKFNCRSNMRDRYEERDNNNLQFGIQGNRVIEKILDWLYIDSNMYVERKYKKYLELKEENKRVDLDDTLYGSAHKRKRVIRLDDLKEYNSLIDCARDNGYVGASSICVKCKKKKDFMYIDDYKSLEGRTNGIR